MSKTVASLELGDRRADEPPDRGSVSKGRTSSAGTKVVRLVAASLLGVVALSFFGGGGWALWKDRLGRDAQGYVSIGTTTLRTETFAIVGKLHGDGPSWLWESGVLGHSRVRATSQSSGPLFIGIARTSDVSAYLRGAGYATIDRFEVRADTTHSGGPPTGPPSGRSIWAASTQGTGQQTLLWNSRSGDWSVVFMNADAGANVSVRGDASAKLPILPWVASGLLLAALASGLVAGWVLARTIRRDDQPVVVIPES
jgi:hypothetical protein